jgi:hypothetical protein
VGGWNIGLLGVSSGDQEQTARGVVAETQSVNRCGPRRRTATPHLKVRGHSETHRSRPMWSGNLGAGKAFGGYGAVEFRVVLDSSGMEQFDRF